MLSCVFLEKAVSNRYTFYKDKECAVWLCRKCMLAFATIYLVYCMYAHVDYNSRNYQILLQLKESQQPKKPNVNIKNIE